LNGWFVVVGLSAGATACNSCRIEEVTTEPSEAEGSAIPEPVLVIEQMVRRHAGEPLSTVAVHTDGRIALFGQSGAFVVTSIGEESEDPPTQTASSPVMDAEWVADSIVGLETAPAALVLWDSSAQEQARIELPGDAVDLWADDARGVVWTLTRVGGGAEVRAHAIIGQELEPRLTHAIGGQPVGLYGAEDVVYAPTFLDRTITAFSASDLVWKASTPVQSRPLFVHPMQDGFAVVGANAELVELVRTSGGEELEMAQPQWIRELDGRTYAFTSGNSVLHRLDSETLEERTSTEELGLVLDIASIDTGLAVIDAGNEASIALLDPHSLELIAGRVAEGRPATISATGPDTFVVVSPGEGMITSYRVVLR
jgi:hypothetical protein